MGKNNANYVPLSPISFIQRAAAVHKNSPAYVFEETERTWGEAYERCQKITAALKSKYEIGLNDVCAVFSRNVPEMFELHYAIPMTQGVILTMNTRLDAPLIRYCLENSEAKVLFADNLNPEAVAEAVKGLDVKVINLHDASHEMADCHYNDLLEIGDPSTLGNVLPADEWQPIALSYTSGTTAKPKGVIYHHRGAYLMGSLSVPAWNLTRGLTYLYLVPMFHCNGWGFPWTSAVLGAKLVLLNNTGLNAKKIFDLIVKHKVTHFGGAPIVLNMLLNDPNPPQLDWTVQVMTAGAPPTPTTLSGMKKLGMEVMQVYGLTETYGHISHCLPQDSWGLLDADAVAEEQAKQGVCYPHTQGMEVWDKNGKPVPADGETMGEVVIRGNCVMAGYLKNPEANKKAFVGGWFHSGDLAVMHPDGYMQIKDREKDIIISGGENISSVEVQACLCKHPAILNAAVVAKPHPKWGETPCAFLELKSGAKQPSIEELKEHCKNNMARFKCPGEFRFMDLPRTATGKIQKYVLRGQVKKEAAEKTDETSETSVKKELEQKAEDSTKEDTSNKVG